MARRIVGISGNLSRPSRTRVLVEGILAEISGRGLGGTEIYDLVDAGPGLVSSVSRENPPEALDLIWGAIEAWRYTRCRLAGLQGILCRAVQAPVRPT